MQTDNLVHNCFTTLFSPAIRKGTALLVDNVFFGDEHASFLPWLNNCSGYTKLQVQYGWGSIKVRSVSPVFPVHLLHLIVESFFIERSSYLTKQE